jgi:muconolactone D-isomerase
MLFHVEMIVSLPSDMSLDDAAALKRRELDLSQKLQREGKWRHLWRVAGKYANVSIFDVADADELHNILTALPLFPYMTMAVTALCRHASSIDDTDR